MSCYFDAAFRRTSHYFLRVEPLPVLKAVFACDIDSKISYKDINSGGFSNRNCGMEEGGASSMADIDEVGNLINGGLF